MSDTRQARLFVLAGPDLARSFALGERTTLGRADECEVVLRDRSISRKHALLVRQGEQWFVQDLGSTNGVSKDGQRAERFELKDGDEFKLGDLPLRLRLVNATEEEIEFDPTPAAPERARPAAEPKPPALVHPPRVQQPSASAPTLEHEVEIEESIEIEIEGPDAGPSRPARAPPPPATGFRPPRAERRTGFFAADLSQHPLWLRGLIVLVLLALCGALAYGAFLALQMLRGGP
ncbi:MAG: FHA domain-containing protein [Planctomycetes bacterium]|nr:FHA domain-containing protein [Planctomycetota bacterium]